MEKTPNLLECCHLVSKTIPVHWLPRLLGMRRACCMPLNTHTHCCGLERPCWRAPQLALLARACMRGLRARLQRKGRPSRQARRNPLMTLLWTAVPSSSTMGSVTSVTEQVSFVVDSGTLFKDVGPQSKLGAQGDVQSEQSLPYPAESAA